MIQLGVKQSNRIPPVTVFDAKRNRGESKRWNHRILPDKFNRRILPDKIVSTFAVARPGQTT